MLKLAANCKGEMDKGIIWCGGRAEINTKKKYVNFMKTWKIFYLALNENK